MNLPNVLIRSMRSNFTRQLRHNSSKLVKAFDLSEVDTVPEYAEEAITVPTTKLQKSRLQNAHRRILMGQKPYDEPVAQFQNTVKYKRKLLGQYGIESSGVAPGVAWPTMEEVAFIKEYEKTAYPKTLQEQWQDIEERDRKTKQQVMLREAELEANMLKVEKWKEDLQAKIEKKKAEIEEAQNKKAKIVEEIRRHFGYNIPAHDERFKKMLQEKEDQEKQKRKEERKQIKMERKAEPLKQIKERLNDAKMKNEPALNKNEEENITDVMGRTPNDVKNN